MGPHVLQSRVTEQHDFTACVSEEPKSHPQRTLSKSLNPHWKGGHQAHWQQSASSQAQLGVALKQPAAASAPLMLPGSLASACRRFKRSWSTAGIRLFACPTLRRFLQAWQSDLSAKASGAVDKILHWHNGIAFRKQCDVMSLLHA